MSCHDPKREFCPHAGMMAAQSEAPASFAGKVAGDARLRVRAAGHEEERQPEGAEE